MIPGSKSRPADIYLPCCAHGKPTALDVSVIFLSRDLLLKNPPCPKATPSLLGKIANTLLTQTLAERLGFPLSQFWWRLQVVGVKRHPKQLHQLTASQVNGQDPTLKTPHIISSNACPSLWWSNSTMWLVRSPPPSFR